MAVFGGDDLLSGLIRDAWLSLGDDNTTAIATAVLGQLNAMAIAGDPWAQEELARLTREGLRRVVRGYIKSSDTGTVRIAHTGRVASVSARIGVRTKRADGTRGRVYQQPLWWEQPWEDFAEFVDSLNEQVAILGGEAEAYGEVLTLRERFPETRTPGEACELAGIDPRSFAVAQQ